MPSLPGGPLRRGWQPAARSPRGPKPHEHHFFGGRERGVPEPHAKFHGFLAPDKLAVAEVGRATRAPQCPQGSLVSPRLLGVPRAPLCPYIPPPPPARGFFPGIAPLQPKTGGKGNNAQTKQRCQRGEETLSRQKVPLRNNISVSPCTMLSCPAPLSRL